MQGVCLHAWHALLRVQAPELVDEHRLARRHVAHQLEGQHGKRHAFGRQHVFHAPGAAPLAQHQRADAVRITEAQHAMADDHGHHCVGAAAAAVYRIDRREDVAGGDARRAHALHLGGEHIEQHFGIGAGVQVAAILARQDRRELGRVGEVAVVPEADAVGRVDVERLHFGFVVAAGRGIAHMRDAHVATQGIHVVLAEYVAHQAATLAGEEFAAFGGHDARGILATMLQHGQRVIELLVDHASTDDTDDTAHPAFSSLSCRRRNPECTAVPRPERPRGHWQPVRPARQGASAATSPRDPVAGVCPRIARHTQHHHAARQAEQETEETVGTAEQRHAHEMLDDGPDNGADDQDYKEEDPRLAHRP